MTAPKPLHPGTLAAHLRRKGFVKAERDHRHNTVRGGFDIRIDRTWPERRVDCLHLAFDEPFCWGDTRWDRRAELEKMIAALAPEFEVTEDLGSRVVVRRKGSL